ncbi:uncharacterized protein LOC133190639 [Saccostrea echinata]|uniref:uncharacterized protein LOC133190639 n=1 Tax=Saccostrea echinata TaxID=191078 RepID=UPI002A825E65|nr:uncharacterized protein LOC133190639 [Saccostrea echinata]
MMMEHFVRMMGFSLILSPYMYFTAFGFFFDSSVGVYLRVLVNQTLEMNCTVFEDSGLNASLLDWVIYNASSASPDTVFINEERTLTFRKKITSVEEEGSYLCKRTDKGEPAASFVKTVSLIIEYEAVRNVTNFTCILNEEKNEFHCRWELGLYNHPDHLHISIIMSPDNGSTVLPCPEKFTGKYQQNCSWAEKDGFTNAAIFSMSKIVILNVTNLEFNVVKSFRMEYITENIKKPLPTEYINALSLGSCGCANVSWETIPGEVKTSSQVSLMSQWNSTPLIHNVDVNKSLIVCNLIPATTYTVEVKIKPLRGLYYSDPKQNNFDTCETVPSLAPSMQPSGYSSEIYNSGNRSITVYWEKIPRKFQNGPLKEYRVSLGDENWKKVAPNATSGTIDIPCGGHNISVQGCNRRGCSPDSSIYIPAYRDVASPQKVIVEQMGLSKVQISWFGLEREAILANDVAWCKVKPAILQCQGEIHILRRTGNMNQTVLHADTIDQALDDVIFGVAAISDKNVSSGIKWQEECRYVKDAVPRPVQTKPLLPDPPKNSLVVSWIPLKCDSGASNNAYIKMYQIIYCQLNTHGSCKGGEFSVNVPADSTTQYTLRNLEADTEYGVWVQAMSLTKEGHKSKMVSGRPTNDDLPDASIAGIAIGGIFVLVLVIAGFVCVCRQVKRKLGLDETFDIENIQVRRFENLPTGSNLYNLITTPADRSSSPLFTPVSIL